MTLDENDKPMRTSVLLLHVLDRDHDNPIIIQDFLDSLGSRVYGLGMLLFALPNCIPMIPGVSGISGAIIMVMALQMAMGRRTPWLPETVRNRIMPRNKLLEIFKKALPKLYFLERIIKPRFHFFDNYITKTTVAIVIAFLGFLLMLPIPIIGNIPPAWSIALLSMSLIEKDGLILIFGMILSVLASYFMYFAMKKLFMALIM